MGQDEFFVAELQKSRADEPTRQIYADWLEERSPTRARFIRLELEFANTLHDYVSAELLFRKLAALILNKRTSVTKKWVESIGFHYDYWLLRIEYAFNDLYANSINDPIVQTIRRFSDVGYTEALELIYGNLPVIIAGGLTLDKLVLCPNQFGSPDPISRPSPDPVFEFRCHRVD